MNSITLPRWTSQQALGAIGVEADLRLATGGVTRSCMGITLSYTEIIQCATALKESTQQWQQDLTRPLYSLEMLLSQSFQRLLERPCVIQKDAIVSDDESLVLLTWIIRIPDDINLSQWGAIRSRLENLLLLCQVKELNQRIHQAFHQSLTDQFDDWVEEAAIEALSMKPLIHFSTIDS